MEDMEAALQPAPHASSLLRLPPEIRLEIFQHCLVREKSINTDHLITRVKTQHHFNELMESGQSDRDALSKLEFLRRILELSGDKFGLFRVSKVVSEETLNVYYGQNVFRIWFDYNSMYLVPEANLRRLRKIRLLINSSICVDPTRSMFSLGQWPNILPGLHTLILVVLPLRLYTSHPLYLPEKLKPLWVARLNATLKDLGEHLPSSCTVEVGDYRKEVVGFGEDPSSLWIPEGVEFRSRLVFPGGLQSGGYRRSDQVLYRPECYRF